MIQKTANHPERVTPGHGLGHELGLVSRREFYASCATAFLACEKWTFRRRCVLNDFPGIRTSRCEVTSGQKPGASPLRNRIRVERGRRPERKAPRERSKIHGIARISAQTKGEASDRSREERNLEEQTPQVFLKLSRVVQALRIVDRVVIERCMP